MTEINDWTLETNSTDIYVLDTSVLIYNPTSISSFGDALLVIPWIVLDELDKLKRGTGTTGRAARTVIRFLNSYFRREEGKSGTPQIKIQFHSYKADPALGADTADNLIITVCKKLKDANVNKSVQLVSKDLNLSLKASQFYIGTKDYVEEYVDVVDIYSGQTDIEVEADVFRTFHANGFLRPEDLPDGFLKSLLANICITIRNKDCPSQTGLGIWRNGLLERLPKAVNLAKIKPRNREQQFAAALLLDRKLDLITLTGPAGVGKTLLAVASGLQQVRDGIYDKLLVSRPIQPLGKDIGYLPGSIDEKLDPWMSPIRDAVDLAAGLDGYDDLGAKGMLEIEPLTYIRGRSIPNVFFVLDEAQQLSRHEMKTILTRMGSDSKIVLTGDINQIDNPYLDAHNNGLTQVLETFKGEALAGHIAMTKGERSRLATLAASLL